MGATKEELESWHRDKAVKDSLVESRLCVDCGVNTAPGFPDGPTARIEIALYGKSIMRFSCENEVYHVRNRIWREAGMKGWDGCLCIGCLEKRLGRRLRPRDFALNDPWKDMPCTDRLLDRRGLARVTIETEDGSRQVICRAKDAAWIKENEHEVAEQLAGE